MNSVTVNLNDHQHAVFENYKVWFNSTIAFTTSDKDRQRRK